jgi:membrane-associated phospholipid phosphatase
MVGVWPGSLPGVGERGRPGLPEFNLNNLEVFVNTVQRQIKQIRDRRWGSLLILASLLTQFVVLDLSAQTVEPLAGTWKTWAITSGSQFRLQAPPSDLFATELTELKMLESQRNAAALDIINYWDAGSPGLRWIEMLYPLGTGAVNARSYALLSVAIYDATIAAWNSKYTYNRPRPSQIDLSLTPAIPNPQSPSYPSEHAAVAGAASEVLAYLFPAQTQFYRDKAEEAALSRLQAGVQYRSDVTAGLQLGRAVAAKVIEWARADRSATPWTGTVPTGPCRWRSETGAAPAIPLAGTWRTWVLTSGDQVRPGPPPDCNSDAGRAEAAYVATFPRSFNTNEAAFYWQGPRSIWNRTVSEKIDEYRLDKNPPRAARAYALTNIAWYDTVVACWDAKYTYWQIRPYQQGTNPVFPTPNHPSYPGAHACSSSSAAGVLAYLFPRDAVALNQRADEAGESRIWAGIHYRSDTDAGLALGRTVARMVIDRAKNDGSQITSSITGLTLNPTNLRAGDSFTATISGGGLSEKTYFDIRFRAPGATNDEVALNWQRGTSSNHTLQSGTSLGTWTITGIRSHEVIDDFSGGFESASAVITVIPR